MLVSVGLVLFLYSGTVSSKKRGSPVLSAVWSDVAAQYLEREGWNPGCKDCKYVKEMLERHHPELNLTDLRLERAKQDILRSLGIPAPPNPPLSLPALPGPIAAGSVFSPFNHNSLPKKTLTERVIAIATDISCAVDSSGVKLKLKFLMPEQVRKREVLLSAKLWLYSTRPRGAAGTLSAKPCGSPPPANVKPKPISFRSLASRGGWLDEDVTRMLQDKDECYNFKIAWTADSLAGFDCSLYLVATKKPFLMMDVVAEDVGDVFRGKRNVNCAEGVVDCCREKLYISFEDIGWDKWLIHPKGYDAYYCKGNCASIASLSLSATPYHSVIKKLSLKKGNMLDYSPCCTPTTHSAVQLIYVNQNSSIVQKTIPNLTVETCGCM